MEITVRKIEISTEMYSNEAVMNAIYKYSGQYFLKAEALSNHKVLVEIKCKDNNDVTDDMINNFYNELADQQTRINVGKEFRSIREEIVKKAFASINK